MKYRIAAESAHRIRIRLCTPALSKEQAEILKYAFSSVEGVTRVTVYPATAGCAFEYVCDRSEITRRLDKFRFENVKMLAREERDHISSEEMRSRKLDPALKRRLRMRILAETAAVYRMKDEVMKNVTTIRENAEDISAAAKDINEQRAREEEAKIIEDAKAILANAEASAE